MPTPERGATVNVREIWPHEEHDFTPWLADHLDLLGKALGLKLEYCQTEAPVGPFFLDILAREIDKDVKAAIENQLQETDHDHLGKLLTYAAEYNAQVAIWVASDFVYEHARALHRLNEVAGEDIRFYGVKVEAIKKAGDACPEPRFRKVVYPGGWNKGITLASGEMSPTSRRYHDFFEPLITKLLGEDFADRAKNYYGNGGRFFPSRLNPDIGYAVYLEEKRKNDAWVTLLIPAGGKKIFDDLYQQKKQIKGHFEAEAEWLWQGQDNQSSYISMRRDGSIDDEEKWEEIRAWMLEQLQKLKEVLDPHLERVLKELQPEGTDGDGAPTP